jgi:hypothetical protein
MSEREATLMPCPFCGGKAELSVGKNKDGTPWNYVQCTTYGCGAIAEPDAWNERIPGYREAIEAAARVAREFDGLGHPDTFNAIAERIRALLPKEPNDPPA